MEMSSNKNAIRENTFFEQVVPNLASVKTDPKSAKIEWTKMERRLIDRRSTKIQGKFKFENITS